RRRRLPGESIAGDGPGEPLVHGLEEETPGAQGNAEAPVGLWQRPVDALRRIFGKPSALTAEAAGKSKDKGRRPPDGEPSPKREQGPQAPPDRPGEERRAPTEERQTPTTPPRLPLVLRTPAPAIGAALPEAAEPGSAGEEPEA